MWAMWAWEWKGLGWMYLLCILLSSCLCLQTCECEVQKNTEFVVLKMPVWRRESSTQAGAPCITAHLFLERKTQAGKVKTFLGTFQDVAYTHCKRTLQIVQVSLYSKSSWRKTKQNKASFIPLRSMFMEKRKSVGFVLFCSVLKHTNRGVVGFSLGYCSLQPWWVFLCIKMAITAKLFLQLSSPFLCRLWLQIIAC